jgi:hypothetical protein
MEQCLIRALVIDVSWLRIAHRGVGSVQARAQLQQTGTGKRWQLAAGKVSSAHQRSSSCNFCSIRPRGTGGDELHLQESCRRLMFLSFVVQNEMFGEKSNHSKAKRSSRPTTNGGRASQGVGSSKESRTSSGGRAS